MGLPEQTPSELDEIEAVQGLAFSEECMRTCPQLQQKTMTALMKFAIGGGELIDHINEEIERAKADGELPEHCELGPTTISAGESLRGGYKPRINASASTYTGQDPWGHPVLSVCQIDRNRIVNFGEPKLTRFEKPRD